MKLRGLRIHNFRSIIDADIEVHDYTMIVGANNAGKSNLLAALRAFYEDIKWSNEDFPKTASADEEAWVELTYELTDIEWGGLAEKYKNGAEGQFLTVRRYFASKDRVKSNQSNIYGVLAGEPEKDLFYGAKNVGTAKVGRLIYIPALTTAADQMKTTGPSPLRDMLNFMLKRVVSDSAAYKEVESAFGKLNEEARGADGFLSKIADPINAAIRQWGIRFDMSVNSIAPDEITKNLVKHGFADAMLGDTVLALDRYGHGFQRSSSRRRLPRSRRARRRSSIRTSHSFCLKSPKHSFIPHSRKTWHITCAVSGPGKASRLSSLATLQSSSAKWLMTSARSSASGVRTAFRRSDKSSAARLLTLSVPGWISRNALKPMSTIRQYQMTRRVRQRSSLPMHNPTKNSPIRKSASVINSGSTRIAPQCSLPIAYCSSRERLRKRCSSGCWRVTGMS